MIMTQLLTMFMMIVGAVAVLLPVYQPMTERNDDDGWLVVA